MTDSNYTAIAVVVDRSGSMVTMREDAEGGLNTFIEDQKKEEGRCTLRLDQFDDHFDTVFPSKDIQEIGKYTLVPRGGTALLDAIGKTVTNFGEELAAMPEDERPGNVIVVVVTDGGENMSREWTGDKVKELIKQQEEQYGWTFVFLAANQDAIAVGGQYGFNAGTSLTYTGQTVGSTYSMLSGRVSATRAGASFDSFTDSERASVS